MKSSGLNHTVSATAAAPEPLVNEYMIGRVDGGGTKQGDAESPIQPFPELSPERNEGIVKFAPQGSAARLKQSVIGGSNQVTKVEKQHGPAEPLPARAGNGASSSTAMDTILAGGDAEPSSKPKLESESSRRVSLAKVSRVNKHAPNADDEAAKEWAQVVRVLEKGPGFWNASFGVINQNSTTMHYWDALMFILLLYTAVVTPYEVAFLETRPNTIFFINRFVDFCFITDIVINFYLPCKNEEGNLEFDKGVLRRRYLRGWFSIDLCSVLPWEVIALMVSAADKLKVVRNLKCLRITKLIRIMQGSRIFKRWESRLEINYASLNMVALLQALVMLSHWMACCWAILLRLEGDDHITDFCRPDDGFCNSPINLEEEAAYQEALDLWSGAPFRIYIQLLFWSFGLVIGVGYQLMIRTDMQRMLCLLFMVTAGITNAMIIGNVVNLMESQHMSVREFQASMDHLNKFLREKGITASGRTFSLNGDIVTGRMLAQRLREFYIFKFGYQTRMSTHKSVIQHTCPSLTRAITDCLYAGDLQKVPFFRTNTRELIAKLMDHIETQVFCAHDCVFNKDDHADHLYIIMSGSVFVNFDILSAGSHFGECVFYATSSTSTYGHTATCLSNSVLYKLTRPVIIKALEEYGDSYVCRSGRKIAFLTIFRLHGNMLIIAEGMRHAAAGGIRHGYSTGVQRLVEKFGRANVLNKASPLLGLYSSYTQRLMRTGALNKPDKQNTPHRMVSGKTTYTMDRMTSQRLVEVPDEDPYDHWLARWTHDERVMADQMRNIKEEATGTMAHLSWNKQREMSLFLRQSAITALGVDMTHITALEKELLDLELLAKMRPKEIANLSGMPTGVAYMLIVAIRNRGYEHPASTRQMSSMLQSPQVSALGVSEAHVVSLEEEALSLEDLRELRPTELAAISGMKVGVAMKLQRHLASLDLPTTTRKDAPTRLEPLKGLTLSVGPGSLPQAPGETGQPASPTKHLALKSPTSIETTLEASEAAGPEGQLAHVPTGS